MRAPTSNRARQRGFSLVEVLIALLILGFIALGIASLFTHAQLTNASGYGYALLASEARQTLEIMQGLPFDAPALADTGGAIVAWPAARPGFTIRYTVEDYGLNSWNDVFDFASSTPRDPAAWPAPGAGGARLKRITIRVSADSRLVPGRREFVASALKIPDSI